MIIYESNNTRINGKYTLDFSSHTIEGERRLEDVIDVHSKLELSIVGYGTGKYYIGDKIYDMKKNDVFIISNTDKHALVMDKDETLKNIVIHFEPRFIWSDNNNFDYRYLKIFFNRSKNFCHRLDRHNEATEKIISLFYEIEDEFNNKPLEYELMAKVKLMNILVLLLRHYNYVYDDKDHYQFKKEVQSINKVTDYIHENYDKKIKLDDLATIVHMNTSYFSTFFKKFNGLAPSEYISRIRISKAMELLEKTDKNIIEICGMCGFNSTASFNKMFKKIKHLTPSEYKKQYFNQK